MEENQEKKKGLFGRLKDGLAKTRHSFTEQIDQVFQVFRRVDEELFDELEESLIMADLGGQTSMEIIEKLREEVKRRHISDAQEVKAVLCEIIAGILESGNNRLSLETKPSVIMVIGVNGVGKTTTIGKLAAKLQADGKKVMLAAADTFRAAAIDQLEIWAKRTGVDIVKHQEGSDPASVVFDAANAAKARGADVLICDTAGRLHNKKNLMEELKKIDRVLNSELPGAARETLLVLDATPGQNAVSQAEQFSEAVGLTGIVLTKIDGTAKGGIVISIESKLSIPVKYVGVGEGVDDLQEFDGKQFAAALFGEDEREN